MTPFTYLRAQAYNNAWANHRLLSTCRELTPAELSARRTNFFPSIVQTLNHILTVDWFYVSALEGACVGNAAFDPEVPCRSIGDIEREQRSVDRRLIAVSNGLGETGLGRKVELPRDYGTQSERADRVLLHLFQHQVHHRGQVHAMLAGTRLAPPQLDEFFLEHEIEQARRTEEFAELAFDEKAIWR